LSAEPADASCWRDPVNTGTSRLVVNYSSTNPDGGMTQDGHGCSLSGTRPRR
jgi:hypothetical protein